MKTIYKFILVFVFILAVSVSAFGAQVVVKTMPLGEGITSTGLVRVVVKVTDQHVGQDLGVILHEESPYALNWDYGIGIMMFQNLYAVTPNTSQIRGYDGTGTGSFITASGTKNITKGTAIALWFDIDIAAKTHRLVAQTSADATPAEVYAGYISRSSLKLKASSNAKYCTVFYNDVAATSANGGQSNTAAAIQVLSDAQIVSSVEAFDFTTGIFSTKATDKNFTIFPSLADEVINMSADEEISSVRIFSLEGKVVLEGKFNNQVQVSALKAGSYVVEAKTVSDNVLRKTFLKK